MPKLTTIEINITRLQVFLDDQVARALRFRAPKASIDAVAAG